MVRFPTKICNLKKEKRKYIRLTICDDKNIFTNKHIVRVIDVLKIFF